MVAGGAVDTASDRINLRVTGAFNGVDAIAAVPVQADGRVFRLGDIAQVKRGYEDPPGFLVRTGGKAALGLGVSMQDGANIVTLGENLKNAMRAITFELPVGIEVTQIADQPQIVEHSVSEFLRSFAEALAIVLVVSFISLGWRTGIVVALSVPLVLAIVFVVMFGWGMDLHRITLGALIIALGLLVDDAIIAIEMMVVKMEQGWDRARAATFAWTSTAFPMLTGTLVTAAGFLPVGFAKSSSGEYAGGIFWVVGLALIASWFVAVVFTPYLGLKLLPDLAKHGAHENPDAIYDTRLYRALRRVIDFCLTWRKSVVIVTVLMFVGSLAGFRFVQQQFFPTSTRTELFLEMRMPEGTAIGATDAVAKKAEAMLTGDKDIATYTTYVGQGAPRFWLGLNPVLPNPNFAQIVIVTKDLEARERVKARLEKAIADGELPAARTRVDRFVFGPPVGFPVQFRVLGPDPMKVRAIAEDVRKVMAQNNKVIDPHLDWSEQVKSIRLEVDQDRARALGLTPQDVSQTLQTLLSGLTVTQYREGIENIDVVARATDAERLELGRLPTLTIATRNGVAGAAVADRAPQLRIRGADHLAAQPRHRAHRARRHRRRRAAARRQQRDRAEAAIDQGRAALRLSHRDRRLDRGKRQGERRARRGVPRDGGRDAGAADDPAAKLLAPRAGVRHGAARTDRRDRRAADRRQAVRLRRAARPHCVGRHDHAQHRDPGRPDRHRHRGRAHAPSGDHRRDGAARPPGGAHRTGGDPRHDPARAQHLLGPDGDHHHGRVAGRDRAHAAGRAGALRALVPGAARRGCGNGEGCGARGCGATLTADRGGIILLPLVPATRLRTRLRRAESSVRRSFSEGEKRGPSSSIQFFALDSRLRGNERIYGFFFEALSSANFSRLLELEQARLLR